MLSIDTLIYLVPLGIVLSVFLVIRPDYGVLLLGLIYPLTFISKDDIGYTIFMNTFRVIFVITFLAWVFPALLKRTLSLYKMGWCVALLLSGAFIASLKGGEFVTESIQGIAFFKYLMYAGLAIMVPNILDSQDRIKQFIILFIISTSFVSMLGIMQYTTGAELIYNVDPQYVGYSPSTRLFVGINSNPNMVAIIQLVSLCCISCFLIYGKFFRNMSFLIAFVVIIGSVLLGQSRSALAAFVLSMGITIIIIKMSKLRAIIFISILLLIGFALFLHLVNPYFEERLTMDALSSGSLEYRLTQARAAFLLFMDDPLGVSGDYTGLLYQYGGVAYASTHNIFLKVMMDAGLFGIMGYFAAVISVLYFLIKRGRENIDRGQKILIVSLLSAIMSFMIHAQFHHIVWEYPLWMFMGLALYFRKNEIGKNQKAIISART